MNLEALFRHLFFSGLRLPCLEGEFIYLYDPTFASESYHFSYLAQLSLFQDLGFFWKVLQDKFPYRVNMFRRRVMSNTSRLVCSFFGYPFESVFHLFITCEIVSSVWYRVFRWLGRHVVFRCFFRLFFLQETWLSI